MYPTLYKHLTEIIDLTEAEYAEFVSILAVKKFRKDEFIIEQGEFVDTEYYVLKGCIQAFHTSESGDRSVLQFAIEDWWISDFTAFYNGAKAQLSVVCVEDALVLGLQKKHLEELFLRVPKFERFFRIKITRGFLSLKNRILDGLDKNSKQRYLDFCKTYPNIEKRVPNYQIASYLGIKPQSLSRIRKELSSIKSVADLNTD